MTLHLKMKQGSEVDQLFIDGAGQLNARIKAPAQDEKANTYLVNFLAKQWGIAKSNITIIAGFTNPHKRLEVSIEPAKYERFLPKIA